MGSYQDDAALRGLRAHRTEARDRDGQAGQRETHGDGEAREGEEDSRRRIAAQSEVCADGASRTIRDLNPRPLGPAPREPTLSAVTAIVPSFNAIRARSRQKPRLFAHQKSDNEASSISLPTRRRDE